MSEHISLIAVIVSGIAGFAVGAVWFAPFTFGPLWLRYNPVLTEEIEHPSSKRLREYTAALAGSLIQAAVLALMLAYVRAPGLGTALWLGFLLWLGFTAAPSLVDALFSRRPTAGWLVDAGHRLAVTLVMAFLLGAWPVV